MNEGNFLYHLFYFICLRESVLQLKDLLQNEGSSKFQISENQQKKKKTFKSQISVL